ncbi:MAG: glycosyltransferase [Candidatus Eisenbacteria bacterium]|nr:glycosyltransferase [Candidatus Eisenbacteria bacterium]
MAVGGRRVLFVDFSETATHADTLFSVVQFLAGCDVRYVLDPSYRGFLPEALDPAHIVWLPAGRGQRASVMTAWVAAREVRRFRPDAVHVNGAQGRRARSFALMTLRSSATFSGTHHNAEKLLRSTSQYLINLRIRRYGVLADFIRDGIRPHLAAGIMVESTRPIFFPQGHAAPPTDRTRIVIVGSLDNDRRDYKGLIRLLADGPPLDSRLELLLLGDASTESGRAIRSAIEATPAASQVRFKERFVSFPELFREVEASHAVLPLIHPETPRFNDYCQTKLTGASLLALGFRKPMLLHQRLAGLCDYRAIAIGYDMSELPHLLNRLATGPEELAAAARGFESRDDLDLVRESRRFHDLLGLA